MGEIVKTIFMTILGIICFPIVVIWFVMRSTRPGGFFR